MSLLLTESERARFVEYCRRESQDYESLVHQMTKLKIPDEMIRAHQIMATAYGVVAEHLAKVEEVRI